MKILALELSTARGSLAWLDGEIVVMDEWPNDRKNSGAFFEKLGAVTRKFGAPETIIVGLGPGSYAGTRIAISAAIGLQASSGARLIGFPSICAMDTNGHEYCVVGDARRKSFFFARIGGHTLLEGPTLFTESDLKSKLQSLDARLPVFSSELLPEFSRAVICYPSALVLARLAREGHRSFDCPPLEPIYLREPHVTTRNEGNLSLLG
jgi:tRNA threonylcarbamoyladenosine biosynthesis protein TsaB